MKNGYKKDMPTTSQAMFVKYPKRIAYNVLTSLLVFISMGCRRVPLTLLGQAVSPDGKLTAEFTVDTNTRTNGSDIYRVNLRDSTVKSDAIILELNHAEGLKLKWNTSKNLVISCPQCEISPAAVHFYRVSANGVDISINDIPMDPSKRKD